MFQYLRKDKSLPAFIVMFLCIQLQLYAQNYRPHPLLSPSWQAETEYYSPSQVNDTTLENGFIGGSLNFRIPLYTGKDWLSADGGKPFFAVLSNFGAGVRQTEINFIEPDRLLSLAKIGVTGLMAKGPSSLRNLYMLNLSVSLPTESFWFKPSYLRPHGAFVWRHLYHNNKVWHTIGVTYTPIRGRDIPLPILGAGLKIGNDDQVQFTFPYNLAYTHSFSKKFSLGAKLNSSGGYYYLKTDSIHTSEPVEYRQRFARLCMTARYYTSRFVVIAPEFGIAGKGKLQLDDQKYTQLASLYFKLSIQVRWGKRPAASPILNFDPGDSGFDPNYLVE
ncbi:hypothetical protein BH11BAC2_BH11BAC2_04650 [soil metagenome]